MKKLLIISVFFAACFAASGQSIGVVFDPPKKSIGAIAFSPEISKISAFVAFESGSYGLGCNKVKMSKYSFGLKYNWFMAGYCKTILSSNVKHFKNSFELGGAFDLYPTFRAGIIYDPFNKGGKIIFSLNINALIK